MLLLSYTVHQADSALYPGKPYERLTREGSAYPLMPAPPYGDQSSSRRQARPPHNLVSLIANSSCLSLRRWGLKMTLKTDHVFARQGRLDASYELNGFRTAAQGRHPISFY